MIDGKELPAPSGGFIYSRQEVLRLSLLHPKPKLIDAISNSEYMPKHSTLKKFFPPKGASFSDETVKDILSEFSVGSREWQMAVALLSMHKQHAVPKENIYQIAKTDVDQMDQDDFDTELDQINRCSSSAAAAAVRSITPTQGPIHRSNFNSDGDDPIRSITPEECSDRSTTPDSSSAVRLTSSDAIKVISSELETTGPSNEMKRLAHRIMMFDDSTEVSNVSKKRKISLVKENATAGIIAPRFRLVNVFHFICNSQTKGKKNDHVMHNTDQEAIMEYFT
jgi:hypothetical protein